MPTFSRNTVLAAVCALLAHGTAQSAVLDFASVASGFTEYREDGFILQSAGGIFPEPGGASTTDGGFWGLSAENGGTFDLLSIEMGVLEDIGDWEVEFTGQSIGADGEFFEVNRTFSSSEDFATVVFNDDFSNLESVEWDALPSGVLENITLGEITPPPPPPTGPTPEQRQAIIDDVNAETGASQATIILALDACSFLFPSSAFDSCVVDVAQTGEATWVQQDFEDPLEVPNVAGNGTSTIVPIPGLSDDDGLQLTVTNSDSGAPPVVMSQRVDTPDIPFFIDFDYVFQTDTGSLEVVLDGTLLETVLADMASELVSTSIAVDDEYPDLLGLTDALLEFKLYPGSPAQVILDDIGLRLSVSLVPAPATLGLLALGLLGAGRYRRRSGLRG